MEELRKNSKSLAILNLFVTLVLFVITAVFFNGKHPLLNGDNMKAFTAWMCVMYAFLLPVLYFFWFRFLRNLKDAYPDNKNVGNTAKLGIIAIILYSIAAVVGITATFFDTFIITPDSFGFDMNQHGIFPKNVVGTHSNDIVTGAGFLIAVMYYFLSRLTEPGSTMRKLTVILIFRIPVIYIMTVFTTSIYLFVVDAIFWIAEFLFLMQIHKGFVFSED